MDRNNKVTPPKLCRVLTLLGGESIGGGNDRLIWLPSSHRLDEQTQYAVTVHLSLSGRKYTIGTEYNSRGEMIKQTYPDGSISDRTYHTTGTLNQLKLDSSTVSTRTYDAGRRLTSDVLGNGITESRTYSNDNLLTAINYSNASLGNLTYTWDTNKNKKSESIGGVMSGYGFTNAGTTYDDEDRLTGYQRTNGALSQSWNLTSVGDWNSVTTSGIGFQPVVQNRTHGPTHELLTAGGQTVNTDVKGNITLLPAALSSSLSPTASSLLWDHVSCIFKPGGRHILWAFMCRPPGFEDEEFRQKDRTPKNRINE